MNKTFSKRQQAVLIFALMTTGMGQSLIFAIMPPLGREINLSELQITSLIGVSALVFALAAPFWGRLSDRRGRKPVIIIGLIGYSVGSLVFASLLYGGLIGVLSGLTLYVALILGRCCQALVMSATGPAASAYTADNSTTDQRTGAMARLGTANSLGTILGPAVSGALATLGLLAPLFIVALLGPVAAVLIWRVLPATPREDRVVRKPRVRLSYTDPRIRAYLATAIGMFVGYSAIQQTLGFLLQDKLSLSGIQTAQMTGAALMVAAVFTLTTQLTLMQRLKLPAMQVLRLGILSMCGGAIVIANFDTLPVLAVGMALLGTGMGLAAPAIAAGASLAVTAEEQGAVAGIVIAGPAVGFVVGPICAGALYSIHGPLAPAFAATVLALVLLVGVLLERRS